MIGALNYGALRGFGYSSDSYAEGVTYFVSVGGLSKGMTAPFDEDPWIDEIARNMIAISGFLYFMGFHLLSFLLFTLLASKLFDWGDPGVA